jgi:PAS domain S-box-containing protein
MLVRDFMTSNPKTLKINDTLKDVVRLFYKYKIDVAPVLEQNNKLVGMVTRTNIIEAIVNEIPISSSIDSIMTQGVITISPDNTLEEAWQIPMNHLPVVDYDHRIVGMLNRQEFMKIFYSKMWKANNIIKNLMTLSYNGIIIVNYYGIIKEINEIAGCLIGVKPEEAKDKFIYDILPNSRLMNVIRMGETELNQSFEINGQTLSVNRAPICEGYKVVGAVAVLKDISQEVGITDQLIEKESSIQALECVFESMAQGIIVVGTDNVIKLVNNSYENVMGISREELIGRKADSAVENSRMHIVLKTGIAELAEFQGVKGRQVVVSRVPMFKEGRIIGAIGEAIFKDISEVGTILERGKTLLKVNSQGQDSSLKDSKQLITFESIIGRSRSIVSVKNLAAKAAITDATVLIQGESGTGKDLFAGYSQWK